MKRTLFTLAVASALWAPAALAETTECTVISSVPTTITAQGVYCLKGDLATGQTSGSAILIDTNNVTIDFNGFKIGGLAAGPATEAVGISAINRKNITIRNGNIRGFEAGIALAAGPVEESQGHLIEDMLIDRSTSNGIIAVGIGIVVLNNRVVETSHSGTGNAAGIVVAGSDILVAGNLVASLASTTGAARGIHLADAVNTEARGNTVMSVSASDEANSAGILAASTTDSVVQDNYVVRGPAGGTGIGGNTVTRTMAVDNVVAGYGTAVSLFTVSTGNITP